MLGAVVGMLPKLTVWLRLRMLLSQVQGDKESLTDEMN